MPCVHVYCAFFGASVVIFFQAVVVVSLAWAYYNVSVWIKGWMAAVRDICTTQHIDKYFFCRATYCSSIAAPGDREQSSRSKAV